MRLSLTDRCDLACIYCRPNRQDGYLERRLDLAAWVAMVEGLVQAGVRRVRLTGGEPLLHKDVVDVVRALARLPIDDLALTTNATRLAALAVPLRDAGLQRINVSIDSLDPQRFLRMTRGGDLQAVLEGVGAAIDAGFTLAQVECRRRPRRERRRARIARPLVVGARHHPAVPGDHGHRGGAKLKDRVVPVSEMRTKLASLLCEDEPQREQDRGPARYIAARHDPALRVGFISGTTDTYCKGCDRLRVASDGTLRPCLATEDGVSAEAAARSGDAAAVVDAVARAWTLKPDGDVFKGCTEESAARVSIRAIGG